MSSFTEESIERYLSHKLETEVSIESLVKFPRGSSRETRFVAYRKKNTRSSNEELTEIVLRSDLPAGSVDPSPLDQEYFIYDRLGHTGIPIAKALWWEEDVQWFGRPFYAREKIQGSWNIDNFSNTESEFDEYRINIAKEHLKNLALVHKVDWQSLGFEQYLAVPKDEADAAHTNVEVIVSIYNKLSIEAMPIILEAREWLHDHAPVAPCLSLCKGTNGYGEEVFRDGKLVAFSDWEEASIGDPAADFAFMQGFLFELERDGEVLWNLSMALDYYYEVSGIRIAPESVGYYQLIRALRLLVMSHNAGISTGQPEVAFIRQAWSSTEVLNLSKRVLTTAMGMLPPFASDRFSQLNESVDMK